MSALPTYQEKSIHELGKLRAINQMTKLRVFEALVWLGKGHSQNTAQVLSEVLALIEKAEKANVDIHPAIQNQQYRYPKTDCDLAHSTSAR